MIAQAKPVKGRPLVFFATIALIWVAVRAIAWQIPDTTAAPEALAPQHLASATVQPAAGETVAAAEPAGADYAGGETLVEGLAPAPGAHEHSRFIDSSVAAGHDMLWMSASQD